MKHIKFSDSIVYEVPMANREAGLFSLTISALDEVSAIDKAKRLAPNSVIAGRIRVVE